MDQDDFYLEWGFYKPPFMPCLSRLAEACKSSYKSRFILQLGINANLQLFFPRPGKVGRSDRMLL